MSANTIKSMTGFGRGEANGQVRVSVEISTVNRKQFDCNLALPRELLSLENPLQKLVRAAVTRGYVKGVVTIALGSAGTPETLIDLTAVTAQVAALRAVAAKLDLTDDLRASTLLRLPEVLRSRALNLTPQEVWPLLEEATHKALEQLLQMRSSEGASLAQDLTTRLDELEGVARAIAERVPAVPVAYKETLEQRLAELLGDGQSVDPTLLAREVAVFADRCDVSEEQTRLVSHFKQFRESLRAGGACGRTLDFICQELFREINTTGSKANDATITRLVIEFKAKLEAVREQVQNIE